MARQSATQHLASWRPRTSSPPSAGAGRSCTTSTPSRSWAIQDRWIAKFERPRLRALSTSSDEPRRTPWPTGRATCTSPTSKAHRSGSGKPHRPGSDRPYWGHSNVSDWQAGSSWEHRRVDGSGIAESIGTVLESAPPTPARPDVRAPGDDQPEGPSTGDLRHRALPRDRPAHRHPREPADGEPWKRSPPDGRPCAPTQVAAGDRPRAAAAHHGRCITSCAPPRAAPGDPGHRLLAGRPVSPSSWVCGRAGPAAALQCLNGACMSRRGLLRQCRPITGGGEGDRDAAV